MDVETVRQKWKNVHNAPKAPKAIHANELDHGLTYHSTERQEPQSLNYVPLELWHEVSSKRNHPSCNQKQQRGGKNVNCVNEALHTVWYWSVYLYYFILYFLLFLGSGCASSRNSSQQAGPDDPA